MQDLDKFIDSIVNQQEINLIRTSKALPKCKSISWKIKSIIMGTFPRGTYNQKGQVMIYKFSINNICIYIWLLIYFC